MSEKATLRRASNSFKHGLYAKKLTYSTPGDHQLYSDILHDYVQHYRPITPDEDTLVQQLAALQFRHLKVQTFQADSMRAEVLRQCKNAAPEADGSTPSETAIETRAFEALCEKPAFRLYLQELNRLPNKIQRTIERIHLLIRLRPEIASWSMNQPEHIDISPRECTDPLPKPLDITASEIGEETEQAEETKLPAPPIHNKEDLARFWNLLDEPSQTALIYGPFDSAPRLNFFTKINIPEAKFSAWLREAWQAGLVKLPPKPKGDRPQAA
jgi:hypothetical protein